MGGQERSKLLSNKGDSWRLVTRPCPAVAANSSLLFDGGRLLCQYHASTRSSSRLFARDIQVDQGGLADPVIVDIAPQIKGKLKGFKDTDNDLELVLGDGLIRLDRQNGLYKHPKDVNGLLK